MAGRLEGKIALITGAASGIGLGTVELFVAEGAKVLAADVQDAKGAVLEQRFPGKVVYAHCDVTDEGQIIAAIDKAVARFGGLDILFNNAGAGGTLATAAEITAEAWDHVFALLVRGPALATKHAIPHMLARGGGSVINTASIAGTEAGWGPLAYSTAKCAVIHLSRCSAAELSPQKIRVNAICPGLIATSIFGGALGLPVEVADQMAARIEEGAAGAQPMPVSGKPRHIAEAALYLASDASEFVTGTHLIVDGGITVGPRHAWDPNAGSVIAEIMGIDADQAAALRGAMKG
jgi:NAD(P)-dependent dehydrogenase (short-subunit alcohol dehydrogenase family)